jgi:hypothetical protein
MWQILLCYMQVAWDLLRSFARNIFFFVKNKNFSRDETYVTQNLSAKHILNLRLLFKNR